jgi:hypothetical protein
VIVKDFGKDTMQKFLIIEIQMDLYFHQVILTHNIQDIKGKEALLQTMVGEGRRLWWRW